MSLLEKYLNREPLTESEMIELVPIKRGLARYKQTDHGLIEMNFKDGENGWECWIFDDEEIIKANRK